MDVTSYVTAISQGKFKEALEVIRATKPFPMVCERVCQRPCEIECNRIAVDYYPGQFSAAWKPWLSAPGHIHSGFAARYALEIAVKKP